MNARTHLWNYMDSFSNAMNSDISTNDKMNLEEVTNVPETSGIEDLQNLANEMEERESPKLVCYGCQDYDEQTYIDDFLCKECREAGVQEMIRCDICDKLCNAVNVKVTQRKQSDGIYKDCECESCIDERNEEWEREIRMEESDSRYNDPAF